MTSDRTATESRANLIIEDQATSTIKTLCFRLGGEEFAIDVAHVIEIARYQEIKSSPVDPDFVHGAIDVRGAMIPVIDLRECFEMEPRATSDRFQFVIASISGMSIGLVVDSVTGVQRSPKDAVQPMSEVALPAGCTCFTGTIEADDHFMLMIDMQNLLTAHQLSELAACCLY